MEVVTEPSEFPWRLLIHWCYHKDFAWVRGWVECRFIIPWCVAIGIWPIFWSPVLSSVSSVLVCTGIIVWWFREAFQVIRAGSEVLHLKVASVWDYGRLWHYQFLCSISGRTVHLGELCDPHLLCSTCIVYLWSENFIIAKYLNFWVIEFKTDVFLYSYSFICFDSIRGIQPRVSIDLGEFFDASSQWIKFLNCYPFFRSLLGLLFPCKGLFFWLSLLVYLREEQISFISDVRGRCCQFNCCCLYVFPVFETNLFGNFISCLERKTPALSMGSPVYGILKFNCIT